MSQKEEGQGKKRQNKNTSKATLTKQVERQEAEVGKVSVRAESQNIKEGNQVLDQAENWIIKMGENNNKRNLSFAETSTPKAKRRKEC